MNDVKHVGAHRTRGRSLPAAILLGAALGCAVYAMVTSAGFGSHRLMTRDIAPSKDVVTLERLIAGGQADARVWEDYAEILRKRSAHEHAAEAYRKVLETEPFNVDAQFRCGLSLAMAEDRPALREFLSDLAVNDAKLAVDLLARPEMTPFLQEDAFRAIRADALAQAND